MPRIRIKNIGPIMDTGDIELSAVMLIVGKQSSGKSTFMKILCFCRWIEKRIMLDEDKKDISAEDVKNVSKMYRYKFSQLYIEELEENLFPKSQFAMVKNIVSCIKKAYEVSQAKSYVVMTTHSPYVLTSLNVLMKVALAKEKGLEADLGDLVEYVIPLDWFSAYCMTDEGKMESIVDEEYHFINGDYLDSLSDEISEISSELDEKIYAYEG